MEYTKSEKNLKIEAFRKVSLKSDYVNTEEIKRKLQMMHKATK